MKRQLEEAAALFKENEALAGEDREKANLYRGLAFLALALRRLEREIFEVEDEIQDGPSHFYQRRAARGIRRRPRVLRVQHS